MENLTMKRLPYDLIAAALCLGVLATAPAHAQVVDDDSRAFGTGPAGKWDPRAPKPRTFPQGDLYIHHDDGCRAMKVGTNFWVRKPGCLSGPGGLGRGNTGPRLGIEVGEIEGRCVQCGETEEQFQDRLDARPRTVKVR